MNVLAAIVINFDPVLRIGDLTVRWQTIGVTLALLLALTVAALLAPDVAQRPLLRRTRADAPPRVDEQPEMPDARQLRLDDLVLIVGGIVPGAVLGARLVHALAFWEAYAAAPLRVLDPGVGSLSLLGAVLGGLLTGAYVARLLGAPIRRWMDAAAVPLLIVIGLGKLAQLLGGGGQGLPFEGQWAVAFGGPGPWVSANPDLPSHPSQVYEGLWALIGIPIVLMLVGPRRPQSRVNRLVAWADRDAQQGRLFVGVLAWFLIGRISVGFTWRDDPLVGPLNTEQVLALGALIVTLVAYRAWMRRREPAAQTSEAGSVPQ